MRRTPLRPLAQIIAARRNGGDPDGIERVNIRRRHVQMQAAARGRSALRLVFLSVFFLAGFMTIAGKMTMLAATRPADPGGSSGADRILAHRAQITDRNGALLATNLVTNALYAQPAHMVDPANAAQKLAEIFPDIDAAKLQADLTDGRKFMWVKRKISPEQMQQVHDIGEPGLLFGPREMRLYPNGHLASHVLGGAGFGREGVRAAELVGVAGVERYFEDRLSDPAQVETPLALSLDLPVQASVEHVLRGGMALLNAKGAASVLMDVHTGEVLSLVSLPDFDPNDRPALPTAGDPSDSPLFNRAVQGLYELGSTFKTFTIAQAIDQGVATPDTMVDTRGPLIWGKFKIRDFHDYGPRLSAADILIKSSNIGTARLATEIGSGAQQRFLDRLGLLAPTGIELAEAGLAHPLSPARWSEISTMTISYGHGLSASPLHLAAAYAAMVNGGHPVRPTILRGGTRADPPSMPVISADVSVTMAGLLRQVVTHGTASMGEVKGYAVGGKTGTADKPKPGGGYYDEKVIATFASVFPANAPRYVLIVTLDEPVETSGTEARRTAGWTAVPVAAEIIRRAAPLLDLRPAIEADPLDQLLLTSN